MRKSAHSPEHKLLIKLLVEARQAADLTQQEFAALLGVQQSLVARYESGQRRIDLIEFLKISEVLKLDPLAIVRRLMAPSSGRRPTSSARKPSTARKLRRGPYKQNG